MKNIIALVLVASGLTACGGAPSESDIKTALTKAVEDQNKMAAKFGGANNPMANMMKIEYKSIKKIACNADGDKAYRCDVEIEMKTAMGEQKTIAPVRFIKGSDGWVAAK
jgi:hypothetical protein